VLSVYFCYKLYISDRFNKHNFINKSEVYDVHRNNQPYEREYAIAWIFSKNSRDISLPGAKDKRTNM